MTYGMKISKAGVDVRSASNSNLILNTDFPFLKAKNQGALSVVISAAGTVSVTVVHNFGYYPAYVHYGIVSPITASDRFMGRFGAQSPFGDVGIDSYVTDTKLVMLWTDTSVAGASAYPYTVYFYYYLFYDKLE